MQAAWYEAIGSAEEVLHVGEIDDPSPLAGEVLVEIKTSGVNPSDVKTRAGARGELQFPRIIQASPRRQSLCDRRYGERSSHHGFVPRLFAPFGLPFVAIASNSTCGRSGGSDLVRG